MADNSHSSQYVGASEFQEGQFSSGLRPPSALSDSPEGISYKHELKKLLERRKTLRTDQEKAQAWSEATETLKTYSEAMVDGWNKEIDVYLVFAALFSGILTAFNVQSYPLLQRTALDPTTLALQHISLQLQSFAVSPHFVNSTHPAISVAPILLGAPPSTPPYAIRLNVLLFSSLILSLASTVIGILVKQWLSEYNSGLTGSSREAAQLRQYRLQNLAKWRVSQIIGLIPILLLVSLALFLAGVLLLAWALHPEVALVTSILVAIVALSTTVVTLLPLCTSECAYLSPQTRAILSLWRRIIYPILRTALVPLNLVLLIIVIVLQKTLVRPRKLPPGHSSNPPPVPLSNPRLNSALGRCWGWLMTQFPGNPISNSTWHEYEQSVVEQRRNSLNIDMLVQWYDTTLNTKAVSYAAICLLDQGPESVLDYFKLLDQAVIRQFKVGASSVHPKDDLLVWQVVLCAADVSGGGGLLDKSRRSPLHHVYDYHLLPANSRYASQITQLAKEIATVAVMDGENPVLRSFSASYLAKQVWEALEGRFIKLRRREEPNGDETEDLSRGGLPGSNIGLLQQHMSRRSSFAMAPPEAPRVSDHATPRDSSVARLNYLRSADQYLACAASILSDHTNPPTTTLAEIKTTHDNTITVLQDLYKLVFCDLCGEEPESRPEDVPSGCRDYHNLLCNVLNTLNTHYNIFSPLFLKSSWILSDSHISRFDDLCRRLEEGMKGRQDAVIFGAPLRYKDTILTPKDLGLAMESYRELSRSA